MNIRFAVLAIGLALISTGCLGGGQDQSVSYPHKSDYQVVSCKYGFNDGGQAERAGAPDYRKFLFDKELDYAKIKAVANASAAATLEFVQKEGVTVFAAHDAEAPACAMFSGLPDAPSDLKNEFDSYVAPSKTTFLVGLFIPKDSEDVRSSSATPEIGIRRDANRWTLVHEFSHYLFDTDFRRNGGTHSDELWKRYHSSFDAFNAANSVYQHGKTEANFDTLTEKMQAACAASREVVIRFYAEEMTIETMLRNGVYTEELTYLPFEKASSYHYIFTSGSAAEKELGRFSDELDHLITEAGDKSFQTDYDKLVSIRKDLITLKGKIAEVSDDALEKYKYESASDHVGESDAVNAPCFHVLEADKHLAGEKFGEN